MNKYLRRSFEKFVNQRVLRNFQVISADKIYEVIRAIL